MTDDPLETPPRELAWRRKLSPAEDAQLRSWLAAHPEAQADYGSETALNEALDSLPDAPLSSNFTARVMQAVKADASAARPQRSVGDFLPSVLRWLPRTALVTLTLGVALISYEHFREAHRIQMARDAAVVSEVASLPTPKGLEDYDVIRAMNQSPTADEDLLKILQ